MTTLSQLVDDLVRETGRPDLLQEITRFVNATVREVHAHPERNTPLDYGANRLEQVVTVGASSPFLWTIPNPPVFQRLEAVQYASVFDSKGEPVWAKERLPGPAQESGAFYYYRTGNYYAFANCGVLGSFVKLSWFEYPASLKYYPAASRPASYAIDSGWTYAAGINTPELQEAARIVSTNWVLEKWTELISEGARAKIYKRLSDDSRGRTSYALFQSLRMQLAVAEFSA